jgi:peroxiredoxin
VSLTELPTNLPRPVDDGACDHLPGATLPDLALPCTDGDSINFRDIEVRTVIYIYPMTGRPDVELPADWDEIPGARGCTPQSCAFRDHHAELINLQTNVFGLSTQSRDYQREMQSRLHLPFEIVSDESLALKKSLRLPTFFAAGMELYKRVTLIVENNKIAKVFYPIFPPDQNAVEVVDWLSGQPKSLD